MATQLNDNDRARIMADYHVGISQNALAIKYEVSPATINKLCKGVVRKFEGKVNTMVRIKSELQEESEFQVNAFHREVEQKSRDLQFFRTASMVISKKVVEKVENEDMTMFDLEKAQDVLRKGKENIYGKMPEIAVQVNKAPTTYKWEGDDVT